MDVARDRVTRSVELRDQRIAIVEEPLRPLAHAADVVGHLVQPAHRIVPQLRLQLAGIGQRRASPARQRAHLDHAVFHIRSI